MRIEGFFFGLLLLSLPLAAAPEISPAARKLHFDSILIDTHDDTTQLLLDPAFDLGARHTEGAIDIPRMREGGMKAIFFSIWIPGTVNGPPAVERALKQIEAVRKQAVLHPKDLALATTADEIERAARNGRIAALIGVEGGHMIAGSLETLDRFFDLGARYMTLTHSVNTDWADSSGDKPAHDGLTDFGKKVVAEMNRLGMIVDVSHVSDKTFWDALAVSRAPLIASHSSCRALCPAGRNMTDEMIKALAANGGVIQINYFNAFLSGAYKAAMDGGMQKEIFAIAHEHCGQDVSCAEDLEPNRLQREYMASGKLPKVEWTAIVDHIDHAVKIAGAEHVGLGSDFDGAATPVGMEDASCLPKITDELLKRGYSERDVKAILGGNTLRVMREVESVARRLRAASTSR